MARANAAVRASREGAVNSLAAVQMRAFDASMFIAYMQARIERNNELEAFLAQRFRPEMKPAVEVSVTDSGPGIEPDNLPRVFEPFFTTKPNGIGMGLSISRKIVEAHGGHISAENHPAGGAIFRVTLPAVRGKGPVAAGT